MNRNRKPNRNEMIQVARECLEFFGEGVRINPYDSGPWQVCDFCGGMDRWEDDDLTVQHTAECLYSRLMWIVGERVSGKETLSDAIDAKRELRARLHEMAGDSYTATSKRGQKEIAEVQVKLRRLRVPRDRRRNPAL